MTKTIHTPNGYILAVKVPSGSKDFRIENIGNDLIFTVNILPAVLRIPEGKWQIINPLSKLTEDQVEGLVEDCPYYCKCFKHYSPEMLYFLGLEFNNKVSCWTRLASFLSLMKANEIYLTNPFGEEPTNIQRMDANWADNPITDDTRRVWDWEKANKNTGEWLILKQAK